MSRRRKLRTLLICFVASVALTIGIAKWVCSQQLAEDFAPKIVLNQVGYRANWDKVAFLLNAEDNAPIKTKVVDHQSGKTVATIQPGSAELDEQSRDRIQTLDFSKVKRSGEYYLQTGELKSVPFQIGQDIYQDTFTKLLRTYYLQRCGTVIFDPITGIYHPPCHIKDALLAHDDAFHKAGDTVQSQGGWHDAGDYGKYVATTTVTIGSLFSLYEQYPQNFTDGQLDIPESGNKVPDLLDEMKVGLDWLLSTQRQDGGVYRKLSGKAWPIGKAPHEDQQPRYLYGVSTPETGKFAAVMAMAGRIYEESQPKLAQTYLDSARLAWDYLQTQDKMQESWIDGDDSGSGKYLQSEIDIEDSLKTDIDDRYWAAAELFLTTGDSQYEQYLVDHFDQMPFNLYEWKDASTLGMVDYLLYAKADPNQLKPQIREKLLARADQIMERVEGSGYRLANHRFIWGSNKMTVEEGITLIHAYRLTQDAKYKAAALDQLHYMMGRNHFDQTFVTDVGTHPVENVNHLFARAKKIKIPGLVVGGPNDGAQDNIAPKGLGIRSYLDSEKSYATNEYAIDYNAPLITLLGMLLETS
ncbi:glycoside hydrolase family 9 protein [Acaryochloris marina]|uniref:glycoside hydrolase family 9 protein n=1 Tax=Acaryochloris marina TaxID=155978 RepID=UPI001BB025B1|nr:glycoside hydrolase family 9 protein [Acaryochloris marina]QUY42379.1 glycoside hydrolase family 9 protein [Acaryochloris marina S15]